MFGPKNLIEEISDGEFINMSYDLYKKNKFPFRTIVISLICLVALIIGYYHINDNVPFILLLLSIAVVTTILILTFRHNGGIKQIAILKNDSVIVCEEHFTHYDTQLEWLIVNKIKKINNIEYTKRNIIISGTIEQTKKYLSVNSKEERNIVNVYKMPRIFSEEEKIIKKLNSLKKY